MILLRASGFLLWAPIEAILLARTGFTPGKFLFRVEVRRHGVRPDFSTALHRSALVTVFGLACGIPGAQAVAMLVGFVRLYSGSTYWDQATGLEVRCRELNAARSVAAALVMLFAVGAVGQEFGFLLEQFVVE